MRILRLGWPALALVAVSSLDVGCKAGSLASSDAAVDAPPGGQAGTSSAGGAGGGGGGATGGVTGGGGTVGAAGAAGAPVRDCLPSCVSNLRRNCERPAVDAGTCMTDTTGQHCYSNGVRDITSVVDGGSLVVYTMLDGHTPCYQVFVDSAGVQHFQTLAGQDVAQGMGTATGYTVTCGGTTQNVDFNDPSCATLNVGDCTAGTCP